MSSSEPDVAAHGAAVPDDAMTDRPERALSGRELTVLGGLSAVGPLSMALYLPALPALGADLQVDPARVEYTVTACMLGLAVGQLVIGPVSDRFGRRRPLLLGLLAYALVSVACALAGSLPLLLALRLVQGLAGGAAIVIARAVVRDLCTPAAAARAFSILVMITGIAPVVAPLVGGQLLLYASWNGVFVVLAVLGVLLLIAVLTGLPESLTVPTRAPGSSRSAASTWLELVHDRGFVAYAAVLTLGSGMLYCYVSMSSFVLQHDFGLSPQEFGLVFAAMATGMVLAATLGAAMVRRLGARRTLLTGLVVAVVGAIVLVTAGVVGSPVGWFVVALLPTVSSASLIVPTSTALALTDQGTGIGSASGVLGLLQFGAGGMLAPLLGGLLPASLGLAMVLAMAVCAVLALLVALSVRGPGARARGLDAART